MTPADIDWFDNHDAALDNARLAALVARTGGCSGILLDTEAYQGKLFDYHRQRDAKRRTWSEYAGTGSASRPRADDGVSARVSQPDGDADVWP